MQQYLQHVKANNALRIGDACIGKSMERYGRGTSVKHEYKRSNRWDFQSIKCFKVEAHDEKDVAEHIISFLLEQTN